MTGGRRWLANGLEVTVPLLALGLWALLSAGSDTYYLPPLTEIFEAFADNWLFERIGTDAVPSLLRMGPAMRSRASSGSRSGCSSASIRAPGARSPRSSSSCVPFPRPRSCPSRSW